MKAADWIADFLIKKGATDVFGLPGVVILDFLYAIENRKSELTPHLTYHEQGAAFAASGYAQATGKLGVAYGTRGPGLTNMVTGIADAYYDSIPVMYFTAHSSKDSNAEMRILNNQEMDTVAVVKKVTKYAARVDELEDLQREVRHAYQMATTGRKGPVFLDILTSLFSKEVKDDEEEILNKIPEVKMDVSEAAKEIAAKIKKSKHPVFLLGNGVRQSHTQNLVAQLATQAGIPVLTSRTAQDTLPESPEYFGYVGSHATRYSNFIISKADLIIALGNRLSFPVASKSFRPVVEQAEIIRVDVDDSEFLRPVPNSSNYPLNLQTLLPELLKQDCQYEGKKQWLSICTELKETLWQWDNTPVIEKISGLIRKAGQDTTFVCDVGNHSFWVTMAYAYANATNRIMYSGSFGTLGCALPKSLGAYYSTKCPVVCFAGDQGFQMNIQELQFISQHKLPITIVVLNNDSSGMIREREEKRYDHFVHTTTDSGYGVPDLKGIAAAYQMGYCCIDAQNDWDETTFSYQEGPCLIDLRIDEHTELYPTLPQGAVCQDLEPQLDRDLYNRLNALQ